MRIKKINCNFCNELYFIYDCSEKQLLKYIEKDSGDRYAEKKFDGITFGYKKDGIKKIVFWVKNKKDKKEINKVLNHEVGHSLIYVFEYIGVNIDGNTDEIFLYAQEDIVEQAENFINKFK